MQIKNYEVLINEKSASCGLLVNPQEYDLSFFNDSHLKYEVDSEKKCIKVFNEKNSITFSNIDHPLMYYAYKTETLVIFVGVMSEVRHFSNVYEACLAD